MGPLGGDSIVRVGPPSNGPGAHPISPTVLLSFHHLRTQWESSGWRPLSKCDPTGTSVLYFPLQKCEKWISVVYNLPSLWYSVVTTQMDCYSNVSSLVCLPFIFYPSSPKVSQLSGTMPANSGLSMVCWHKLEKWMNELEGTVWVGSRILAEVIENYSTSMA